MPLAQLPRGESREPPAQPRPVWPGVVGPGGGGACGRPGEVAGAPQPCVRRSCPSELSPASPAPRSWVAVAVRMAPPLLAQEQARLSEDGCCWLCPQPQLQNSEWASRGEGRLRVLRPALTPAPLPRVPSVHLRRLSQAPGRPAGELQLRRAREPGLLPGQLWGQHLHVRDPARPQTAPAGLAAGRWAGAGQEGWEGMRHTSPQRPRGRAGAQGPRPVSRLESRWSQRPPWRFVGAGHSPPVSLPAP